VKDTGQILAEILVGGELKVHLIGVAGSGMSGIAGLLLSLGHQVSGSDKASTVETARLQSLGLKFCHGHDAGNVADTDLVIYSSAIRPGNPEYDEALKSGRNMARRADALSAIMNCKKGIVVCGMHGKTTTSSMCAHVLRVGDLHPSHYVGAEIPILGTNAHWDPAGEYFVAEGDESDGTLALYRPEHAIVLNIEEEHLDYYENLAAIDAVYRQLCSQTRGKIVYCADDEGAVRVCGALPNAVGYGESHAAMYRYDDLHAKDFQSSFRVIKGTEPLGAVTLNVPGRHNVSNALAVIALATELGVPFSKIAEALAVFRGARRRFEIKHRSERFMIVDDYGHHPSEIRATLATARNTGRKRVMCVFQPHRYSRTLKLREEFGRSFHDADFVVVADVYPASEPPIPGITGQTIVDEAKRDGHDSMIFEADRKKIPLEVGRRLEPGDCIITLGAGNIHEAGNILAKDVAILDEIQNVISAGTAKLYEPMSKHTTMRIGGPAQFWVEPETEEGFARLVRFASEHGIPLMVVGRGSNLLVRDGGIRGIVAHLSRGEFKRIEIRDGQIIAGVGVKQKELAYAARDAQIGGFEWLEGIPGDIGGALRMNAGAMGGETFRQVVSVRYIDAAGVFHMETPDQLDVHYRHCGKLERNFAISATFVGSPGTSEEIERKLAESMQKRRTSQPKESSAGCIFKNPEMCPAGKLVDELGLKGARVGGVKVSEVHGNFIVNDEHGTANDVLALIEQIKKTALEKRGITLQTEVQIIGDQSGLHD
jgi:UDP-N-acetylmuramate--alanine ligase